MRAPACRGSLSGMDGVSPRLILKCRELRKSFGDLVAVNGVSLAIAEGEIYGFLGPNGSFRKSSKLVAAAGERRPPDPRPREW